MNKIVYLALTVLLVFILPSATYAVSDWRNPTADDLGKDATWRDEDTDRYLVVKADFDGDGKEDFARLLASDKSDKIGLFVTVSSIKKAGPLLLKSIKDKRTIETFGIALVKPGTYTTACGKGYWDCKKGEREELRLEKPGIDFFQYESANSYFVWNAGRKKFDRIWISD
jgi:hypothetical protein